MGKQLHQGLSNTTETKMWERERVCEWEKMLFSISCQVDGEAGGDPIPPGSLFKLWYKSYSEKTDGPSDRTQLLYWLLLQISLLVWAPSPKGNLSEEPKLGVMLEIGKGFRVKGTAIGSVSSPKGISTLFFVVKIAASERFLQYGHGRMSLPVWSMVGRYVAFLSKCLSLLLTFTHHFRKAWPCPHHLAHNNSLSSHPWRRPDNCHGQNHIRDYVVEDYVQGYANETPYTAQFQLQPRPSTNQCNHPRTKTEVNRR